MRLGKLYERLFRVLIHLLNKFLSSICNISDTLLDTKKIKVNKTQIFTKRRYRKTNNNNYKYNN